MSDNTNTSWDFDYQPRYSSSTPETVYDGSVPVRAVPTRALSSTLPPLPLLQSSLGHLWPSTVDQVAHYTQSRSESTVASPSSPPPNRSPFCARLETPSRRSMLPENPRMRTSQACEKCRSRKAKCSGTRPSCTRCINRGFVCEYSKESRMRGPNKPKPRGVRSRSSSTSTSPIEGSHESRSDSTEASDEPGGRSRSSSMSVLRVRAALNDSDSAAPAPIQIPQLSQMGLSMSDRRARPPDLCFDTSLPVSAAPKSHYRSGFRSRSGSDARPTSSSFSAYHIQSKSLSTPNSAHSASFPSIKPQGQQHYQASPLSSPDISSPINYSNNPNASYTDAIQLACSATRYTSAWNGSNSILREPARAYGAQQPRHDQENWQQIASPTQYQSPIDQLSSNTSASPLISDDQAYYTPAQQKWDNGFSAQYAEPVQHRRCLPPTHEFANETAYGNAELATRSNVSQERCHGYNSLTAGT